ncbi:FtsX-like permease family protein [uncultured Tessaracoccus sp.]|uniref:FtsX-like permease family protein n=1 Tax=uncultured Tessaracoccus sp. TaxID=905023 RepID=UPI0025EF9314|nr:ABC transporter permease [uncultured Tessaracoccus sp.]
MLRHVVRIIRSDWAGWAPSMGVVAAVTVLVTACMNQFVWTSSTAFLEAAQRSGLDGAEFAMVSMTIYTVIALLAVCSLTVVGSATVERTRSTFAQWRLMGASPRQVRTCLWALVGLASALGAVPGVVVGSVLSSLVVPWFNEMAGASFPGGTGEFVPPPFTSSAVAGGTALVLSVVTCLLGAAWPAHRAALVEPVEALRGPESVQNHRAWGRWVVGGLLLACAVAMAVATPRTLDPTQVGRSTTAMVNAATWVGGLSAAAVYVTGPALVHVTLSIAHQILHLLRVPVGQVAARSARAQAAMNANTIAPLAAAVGLGGVIFTATGSYLAVMARAGVPLEDPNLTDVALLSGLFCVMAIATSIAVIALSGRDQLREHTTLRASGMSPVQVSRLVAWQSLCLALCAAGMGLLPMALVAWLVVSCSLALVGSVVLSVPGLGLAAGFLVCWFVLWSVQFSQAMPWLRRETAAGLRHA